MKEFVTISTVLSSFFLSYSSLAAITKATSNNCPEFFVSRPGSNSCYRIVSQRLTWFQANQYCTFFQVNTYSCHLAAIESAEEFEFLVDLIQSDPEYIQNDFWISLNNLDRARQWVWASTNKKLGPANNTQEFQPHSNGLDFVKDPYFNGYRRNRGKLVVLEDQKTAEGHRTEILDDWVSNYTNWAPGEPSNTGKCGIMWRAYRFQWADTSCYNLQGFPFICELHV